MTNREWLLNKMQNMSDYELCDLLQGKTELAIGEIDKEYGKCICKWLCEEHKEKITLSEAERIILENIDKDYKWITRDENRTLAVYTEQPSKLDDGSDFWFCNGGEFGNIECFNHLFQFITWEDEQAYNIEELLKENK